MKLSYTKLEPFKSSQTKDKLTNEQRYWKKYQTNIIQTYSNNISAISCNMNTLQLFAYGHGRSVVIYDTIKNKITKEINSFNNNITSICVRPDGAVFAAGDESGEIEVMDTKQKFHLRTFKNHKKRVNALEYVENDLYSGGDDFILRHFDVASGEVVHSYDKAHSDYIKSIKSLENNHILSAGYDGFVRLFDFRVHQKAQIQFKHEQQLQSIALFPSKLTFVSCGGNKVFLWDIRTGKQLFSACNNKKTVSSVQVINNGSRFITSSFDQYFKVYKSDTFELTYQDKFASSIHCFDVSPSGQHIFIALEGGKLVSKTRTKQSLQAQTGEQSQEDQQNNIFKWIKDNEQKKFAYNNEYFYRGIYEKADNFDIKFENEGSKKVSQYDAFLKKFQYKQALLTSLQKKNMMIYLSLVDQFIQRGCLQRTLHSFTNQEIQKMLCNLLPLIHNSKYSKTTLFLLQQLLKAQPHPAQWKNLVLKHIEEQLTTINELVQLGGMVELVMHNFQ